MANTAHDLLLYTYITMNYDVQICHSHSLLPQLFLIQNVMTPDTYYWNDIIQNLNFFSENVAGHFWITFIIRPSSPWLSLIHPSGPLLHSDRSRKQDHCIVIASKGCFYTIFFPVCVHWDIIWRVISHFHNMPFRPFYRGWCTEDTYMHIQKPVV